MVLFNGSLGNGSLGQLTSLYTRTIDMIVLRFTFVFSNATGHFEFYVNTNSNNTNMTQVYLASVDSYNSIST